jgi:hypothetical protein
MHLQNKILIFHIGCGSGFFSEYLGMVFAIAYCKIHNIRFKLYSKDANFAFEKGWSDYFEPFCEEIEDDFHSWMNRRIPFPTFKQYLKAIYKKIRYQKPIPKWYWHLFRYGAIRQYVNGQRYKKLYGFNYFTYDLWNKFYYGLNPYFNDKILEKSVDTLQYKGNVKMLFQSIIENAWKFNKFTNEQINVIIEDLMLPKNYLGIHIRAGDKLSEDKIFSYDKFFEMLTTINSSCNDVFVLTDDYTIIENIQEEFNQFNIYTLCSSEERGYDNNIFQKQSSDYKKKELIKLFTSIEILSKSNIFVGAYNSNVDIFISLKRDENTYFVDKI